MPRIVTSSAPLYTAPDKTRHRETDCLFGESVTIHENRGDWHEVTLATDGYRGWLKTDSLGDDDTPPTHRVIAPRALITSGADIKTATASLPSPDWLPMGALVTVKDIKNGMAEIKPQGFTPARHLLPIGESVADWVAVAESLIGTPYRFGGRDSIGLDCSALVQLSLMAGGMAAPRNSGEQEKTLGNDIDNPDMLQRGDLVFWPGHVGIMTDAATLLHANMHHAMTATEPLSDAITRFEANGLMASRFARLSF